MVVWLDKPQHLTTEVFLLENIIMSLRKLFAVMLLASMFAFAAPAAFANDHDDHACTADADCEHGEHCKDGHCHK